MGVSGPAPLSPTPSVWAQCLFPLRLRACAHLTSAEVQVQVAHVRVERETFQEGPGRGCHREWRELGKGAPGREQILRRKDQDAWEVMGSIGAVRRWRRGLGGGSPGRGRGHGQRHSPERVRGQLAARQAQVPKRTGAAEEELQRGWRGPGLPEVREREKWASRRREEAPSSLPSTHADPASPTYVREKTFLEASRWVRLAQQPRDSAAKSCRKRM